MMQWDKSLSVKHTRGATERATTAPNGIASDQYFIGARNSFAASGAEGSALE
jgi:hypothetical protein